MSKNFDDKDDLERMRLDPDNYKWGIFYFNPKDSRIFLFKRNPNMGFTLNFANPYSYLILISFLAFTLFLAKLYNLLTT